MLVLTRKVGEKIRIDDNIVVTVLKTSGNSVRIGIEAPANVKVLRAELPPHPTTNKQPVKPLASIESTPRPAALRLADGGSRRQQASTMPRNSSPHDNTASHAATASATTSARSNSTTHPNRWSIASMRDRVQAAAMSTAHGSNPSSR